MTVRGRYPGDTETGWRLVAVLRVVQRFASHTEAAEWYKGQNLSLPSNCFVDGNHAKPWELTNGDPPPEIKKRVDDNSDPVHVIRLWDATYRQRIVKWPVFLATEREFIELTHPPQLTEAQMRHIFGRIPSTLNPPEITGQQLRALVRLATGL